MATLTNYDRSQNNPQDGDPSLSSGVPPRDDSSVPTAQSGNEDNILATALSLQPPPSGGGRSVLIAPLSSSLPLALANFVRRETAKGLLLVRGRISQKPPEGQGGNLAGAETQGCGCGNSIPPFAPAAAGPPKPLSLFFAASGSEKSRRGEAFLLR